MAKKKKYRHPTDHKQAEAAAKKLVADIEDICGPGWTYTISFLNKYYAESPKGSVIVYPGDPYMCLCYVGDHMFSGEHATLAGAFSEALKDVDRCILEIQDAAKELEWSLPKSRRKKKNA